MQSVHIPHDAILQDDVVVTPMCVLAGITTLLRGANIAMGSTIHQYSVIGHYSLVAMGSAVTKNIKPFTIFVAGKPARVNNYAVEKFGYKDMIDEIQKFVLEDVKPRTDSLLNITEEFEKLHFDSKRPLYK
jgi:UDP-N-acetylglucosamine acyltransferase